MATSTVGAIEQAERELAQGVTASVLHVLDRSGDQRFVWDKNDAGQVAEARKQFDAYKAKGYAGFRVEGGGKGAKIDSFDAAAERVIMTPPVRGG